HERDEALKNGDVVDDDFIALHGHEAAGNIECLPFEVFERERLVVAIGPHDFEGREDRAAIARIAGDHAGTNAAARPRQLRSDYGIARANRHGNYWSADDGDNKQSSRHRETPQPTGKRSLSVSFGPAPRELGPHVADAAHASGIDRPHPAMAAFCPAAA